jgi:endonuclease YncB( thermonuclease family)
LRPLEGSMRAVEIVQPATMTRSSWASDRARLLTIRRHARRPPRLHRLSIADGDTLTARCDTPDGKVTTLTVRLAEIDAPERRQPFGTRSRQHLTELCQGKPASIKRTATDRCWRTVARVQCDGIDANAEQVRAGMAWVFDRYATDAALYAIEADARRAVRGLWADPRPITPWVWRDKGPR